MPEACPVAVEGALDQWLPSMKLTNAGTLKVHKTVIRKIRDWASESKIEYLADVTAEKLDKWRGERGISALRVDDRLGPTAQRDFQGRLKKLFKWAARIHLIEANPTIGFASITYGAAPVNLAGDVSDSSGLPITLSIVSGPAKISGTIVTASSTPTTCLPAVTQPTATFWRILIPSWETGPIPTTRSTG